MRKIGIMTWFQFDNYGTVLQALALQKTLSKYVEYVDIINYKNKTTRKRVFRGLFNILSAVINRLERQYYKLKFNTNNKNINKTRLFSEFRNKNLKLTNEIQSADELIKLNNDYNIFICGSDQIWSPIHFDLNYFLDFAAPYKRLISYAPSFGVNSIDDADVENKIKNRLLKFNAISVREETGARIIKKLTNKTVPVVLDPTMLLSANEWDTYLVPANNKEPYILCYLLGNNEEHWRKIKKFSKRCKLKLFIIPKYEKDYGRSDHICENVAPGEFLGLIKNASYVCTDSFHGAIFSFIYQRPLFVFKRFKDSDTISQNFRIYNFVKTFELQDILIDRYEKMKEDYDFEERYIKSAIILESEKNKSLEYLMEALKN